MCIVAEHTWHVLSAIKSSMLTIFLKLRLVALCLHRREVGHQIDVPSSPTTTLIMVAVVLGSQLEQEFLGATEVSEWTPILLHVELIR